MEIVPPKAVLKVAYVVVAPVALKAESTAVRAVFAASVALASATSAAARWIRVRRGR